MNIIFQFLQYTSLAVLPICHCIPPDQIALQLYNELHVMIASRPKVVIISLFSEALIISQLIHETYMFQVMQQNKNYSSALAINDRLLYMWHKSYFLHNRWSSVLQGLHEFCIVSSECHSMCDYFYVTYRQQCGTGTTYNDLLLLLSHACVQPKNITLPLQKCIPTCI